jgi:hypothetical protein
MISARPGRIARRVPQMNARLQIARLCVIAILLAGGCGGEGEERAAPTTTPAATSAASPESTEGESPTVPEVPAVEEAAPTPHAGASEAEPEPEREPEPEPASEIRTPAPKEDALATEPPPEEPTLTYADLLDRIVTDAGLVRYDLLAEPPLNAALDAAIERFADAGLPDDEKARLALWCNAYNANVLSMALAESGKEGFINVLEVPGFFDRREITVAGEAMTLNGLENEKIRPLKDPRTHGALVCAAMSCPPLREEPYTADRLDAQLDDQCQRWVNESSKFRLIDGRLGMSEILKWHGEDFRTPPFGNEIGFVLAYANPFSRMTGYILNTQRPQVAWIPFDWSLNQAPPPPPGEDDGKDEDGEEGHAD